MRFLTGGESHGRGLVAILEGMPAGVRITAELVSRELRRRRHGYGRGERMRKRVDRPILLSGVRHGETIGSPLSVYIPNGERERWARIMSVREEDRVSTAGGQISRPRPGHSDLAGALKYGREDIRDVLERASARETAARVALGACVKAFLGIFGIEFGSHVCSIGPAVGKGWFDGLRNRVLSGKVSLGNADGDPIRSADRKLSRKAVEEIDAARRSGETLGGVFEVIALGVPVGLGSYSQWDCRLDSRLAAAVMSIPGVKGVEIGPAFENARLQGSAVHDVLYVEQESGHKGIGIYRKTNRAGGIEGGVSNGEEIVVRAAMKPLSTLRKPLPSVDLKTLRADVAVVERSDVCAVPAAAIVGESMVAMVIADLFLEKFGGDSVREVGRNLESFLREVRERLGRQKDDGREPA